VQTPDFLQRKSLNQAQLRVENVMKVIMVLMVMLLVTSAVADEQVVYKFNDEGYIQIVEPGQILTVIRVGFRNRGIHKQLINKKVDGKAVCKPRIEEKQAIFELKLSSCLYRFRVRPINGVLTCEKWSSAKEEDIAESIERLRVVPCTI
jgi:hypothetical protein